jgi:integrase
MRAASTHEVLERIDRSGACWTWPGTWSAGGQPLVKFQRRTWLVHRLAYHVLVAPLTPSQRLRKACARPGCVRPGAGHWELSEPAGRQQAAGRVPRGIRYEGTDRQGMDVWRVSVYVGRDGEQGRGRVEQRVRVHGSLEDAVARREELLERVATERQKLAAGVWGKTMSELLDRYFTVWRKTPRNGHVPAASTAYGRHWLIETVIKPGLGARVPAELTPGMLAEWYDQLMASGYTTRKVVSQLPVAGRCRVCGQHTETVVTGRRRTARVACPACPGGEIVCRAAGPARARTVTRQHRPVSASGMGDIHAVLSGAFRFGVQRGWLTAAENPMPLVERRTGRPVKRRPPSPEEVQRALVAARAHPNRNLAPFLAFVADTGARLSEACALRLSALDAVGCAVAVRVAVSDAPTAFGGRQLKDTKTHTERTIALHPMTLAILQAHLAACREEAVASGLPVPEDPFVFPHFRGRGQRVDLASPQPPKELSKVVSAFFAAQGIDATAKSLRSFVVTNWRKARVPDNVLRGRLGHEDGTPVTDRHYHYREAAADRRETDLLVGGLLYAAPPEPPEPTPAALSGRAEAAPAAVAKVVSLDARRAQRRARG